MVCLTYKTLQWVRLSLPSNGRHNAPGTASLAFALNAVPLSSRIVRAISRINFPESISNVSNGKVIVENLLLNLMDLLSNSSKPLIPIPAIDQSLVSDVEWPYSVVGQAEVDANNVLVAVGNTAIDGVAALINANAQKEALEHPNDKKARLAAGETLANLMQAAQYDLLKEYGKPGGAAAIEERIHQAWFGSEPGGTLWEVVAIDPDASGEEPAAPDLTPPQRAALNQQLAGLNTAAGALDEQQRTLASLQTVCI